MNGRNFVIESTRLALVVLALGSGCKAEEDDPIGGASGTNAAAGTTGGTAGAGASGASGAGASGVSGGDPTNCEVPVLQEAGQPCINTGDDNLTCSMVDLSMPLDGVCAPKSEMCHRSSNRAKECLLGPDDPMKMEFRIMQSVTSNMPLSSGLPTLLGVAANRSRSCSSEQCLLFRFTVPRAGGQRVAGDGALEIGTGHYNCDGTYSFYGAAAAPDRPEGMRSGADRWEVSPAMATFDPAIDGRGQFTVVGLNPNREMSYTSFYVDGTSDVDWEIATMGFNLDVIDTSVAGRDGMGAVDAQGMWTHPGKYHSYAPVLENDTDNIDGLGTTLCTLFGFGPLPPEERPNYHCQTTARCMPDNPPGTDFAARTCKWVKLPDSLCPTTGE